MLRSRLPAAAGALAVVTSLALAGCSGSGTGDYCEVLLSDTATSAIAFTPLAMSLGDVDAVQDRLDLLEQIQEPPEELAEPLALWVQFLTEQRDTWQTDPSDTDAAIYQSDEIDEAQEQLFDYYIGTCMD